MLSTAPATTQTCTLSLHDAPPIYFRSPGPPSRCSSTATASSVRRARPRSSELDRKSTHLSSSHPSLSYAVYCSGHHPDLHSFPTRRSSDLLPIAGPAQPLLVNGNGQLGTASAASKLGT